MTPEIIDILRCPICGGGLLLSEDEKSLVCGKRHCFDFARSGYVNIARAKLGSGDSKECVKSRTDFLSLGYYAPIADKLCSLAKKYADSEKSAVIDAGCGEGYYTLRLADCFADGSTVGFDLSKFAVEHGAKASRGRKNVFFAVASVFDMPIGNGKADIITSVFAPCAEKEFSRVLKSGGVLITASAGRDHLLGMKKALYENVYENEERADAPLDLCEAEKYTLKYEIELKNEKEIYDLFSMTPYFYRTSEQDKNKLLALKNLKTEIEINFAVYRKE